MNLRLLLATWSFALVAWAEPARAAPGRSPPPEAQPRETQPLPRELAAPAPDVPAFPPPRALPGSDAARLGAHVTRTLSLLATSTPQRRHRVKVLVYGQSISKQVWSRAVEADLRKRFPHAELAFENRSIGGFIARKLRRTLEHDVVPWQPDLIIFHVYGNEVDYEAVIRELRSRTTAEVIVSTDHVAVKDDMPSRALRAFTVMPALAEKYGLELADARRAWLDYLEDQKLPAAALVAPDGTHLNARGNFLLAEVIKRHLRWDPAHPADPRGLVRTLIVGKDVRWQGKRLELAFEGTRVEVVPAAACKPGEGHAAVLLDGAPPSRRPECYALSRPNADPNRDWPWEVGALVRVDRGPTPLVVEDWTVRLTEVDPGGKGARFELAGSVTGPDGAGTTAEAFTSRSGRVRLDPGDWFLEEPVVRFKVPIRPGFRITWRAFPQCMDTWAAPAYVDPARTAGETLVQDLPNGRHELVLVASGGTVPAIAALRVYRPAW